MSIAITERLLCSILAKIKLMGDHGLSLDRLAVTAGYLYWSTEGTSNHYKVDPLIKRLLADLEEMGVIRIEWYQPKDTETGMRPPRRSRYDKVLDMAFLTEEGEAKLTAIQESLRRKEAIRSYFSKSKVGY